MIDTRTCEILIAEDNPADVALVRRALNLHGVDCVLHVISDGAEVVGWIESRESDRNSPPLSLLLLDMHLPRCDGEAILKYLRSTERYAQTPVIVMTSSESSAVEEKATRHAALEYFRKPSTLDEFMELGSIVRQVLDRKRASADLAKEHRGAA